MLDNFIQMALFPEIQYQLPQLEQRVHFAVCMCRALMNVASVA